MMRSSRSAFNFASSPITTRIVRGVPQRKVEQFVSPLAAVAV
jgi:hypothetical protein